MFQLEPLGTHMIEICTNLPCALCGAQKVVEAFEERARCQGRRDDRGRKVTLRAVECLGGCGYATVVAVDHRYRQHVKPEDEPAIVEGARGPGSSRRSSAAPRITT